MRSLPVQLFIILSLNFTLSYNCYAVSESDLIGTWELMHETKGDEKIAGNLLGTQLWTFNSEGTGQVSIMGINAFTFTWYLNGNELNLSKTVGSKTKKSELSTIAVSNDSFTSSCTKTESGKEITSVTVYARDKSPTQSALKQDKSDSPSPFGALGDMLEQFSSNSNASSGESGSRSSLMDMLKHEEVASGKFSSDTYEVNVPDGWGGMKMNDALMVYEGGKPKSILSPDLTKANFTLMVKAAKSANVPAEIDEVDLNRLKSDMQSAVSQNPLGLDVNVKSVKQEKVAGRNWIKYRMETSFRSGMTLITERFVATDTAHNMEIDIAYTFPTDQEQQIQAFIAEHITTIKLK